jgi:hypothetical protein
MSQTTYYEFNKPEGTDLVNPLVDTNPNWDALDADLHEFNERSISNCTEVVSLGVHTISRLDTTAKFLKWIATANFTAGDTFTVDGLVVAASTPAGATLQTNAYVTGSVVLACLNADNSAMTIYVSGTTVADDSQRLGGELPSYYGTAADVADNASDITNLQNQVGNTSIVGIGDGTCTGAIDALNTTLTDSGEATYITSLTTLNVNKALSLLDGYKRVAFVLRVTGSTVVNTLEMSIDLFKTTQVAHITVNEGSTNCIANISCDSTNFALTALSINVWTFVDILVYGIK